jgi:hypothetical protein
MSATIPNRPNGKSDAKGGFTQMNTAKQWELSATLPKNLRLLLIDLCHLAWGKDDPGKRRVRGQLPAKASRRAVIEHMYPHLTERQAQRESELLGKLETLGFLDIQEDRKPVRVRITIIPFDDLAPGASSTANVVGVHRKSGRGPTTFAGKDR